MVYLMQYKKATATIEATIEPMNMLKVKNRSTPATEEG